MNIATFLLTKIPELYDTPADAPPRNLKRVKDNISKVNVIPSHIVHRRGYGEFEDVPNLVILNLPQGFFDAFITAPNPVTLGRSVTVIVSEQPVLVRYAVVQDTVIFSVQREV